MIGHPQTKEMLANIYLDIKGAIPGKTMSFTAYVVRVRISRHDEAWYVCRRYSDFRQFWKRLLQAMRDRDKRRSIHRETSPGTCLSHSKLLSQLEWEFFPTRKSVLPTYRMEGQERKRIAELSAVLSQLAASLRQHFQKSLHECDLTECPVVRLLHSFFSFSPDEEMDRNSSISRTSSLFGNTRLPRLKIPSPSNPANSRKSAKIDIHYITNYFSSSEKRRKHRPGSVKPTIIIDVSYLSRFDSTSLISSCSTTCSTSDEQQYRRSKSRGFLKEGQASSRSVDAGVVLYAHSKS